MNNSNLQAPVVLVHGIMGFSEIKLGGIKIADYFRDIPQALRDAGHIVPPPPRLNQAGAIADRAQDLKNYLDDETNEIVFGKRVHIVAHSMGGLDTRYMISQLGMEDRIISLTTISTPHQGSPLADLFLEKTDPRLLPFVKSLGGNIDGSLDLTVVGMRDFNSRILDSPKVRHFSVAGNSPTFFGRSWDIAKPLHRIVYDLDGDNDGIVSVKSATFGERKSWTFLGEWKANHFREINWGKNVIPSIWEKWDKGIIKKYVDLVAQVKSLVS
jgi:triacylglycerol lipase